MNPGRGPGSTWQACPGVMSSCPGTLRAPTMAYWVTLGPRHPRQLAVGQIESFFWRVQAIVQLFLGPPLHCLHGLNNKPVSGDPRQC